VGGSSRKRVVAAVVAVLVAAGCGARVSPEQVASVGGGGGAVVDQQQGPVASGEQPDGASPGLAAGPGDADTGALSGRGTEEATTAPSGEGGQLQAADVPRTASDVGITPDTIKIGQVTQLTGPVPGLFAGSVVGIQAFAAYQNSVGGVAGRKVEAIIRDDQFDATANRTATRDLIASTFALVGGISLYDDASAPDVEKSGIPDVTTAISRTRAQLPNNFAPGPNVDGAPTGQFVWLKEKHPEVVKAMASLYGDVPSAKVVHQAYRRAAESLGFAWVYDRGYQPTETDYTADIIRMRQAGAKALFLMSVDAKNVARILKAGQQQGWRPDVVFLGPSSYDTAMLTLAGGAAEGALVFQGYALYAGEDAGLVPEVKLFNQWVQRVKPGNVPDTFAAGAWLAGRLWAKAMAEVGPNPTRADVVAALRKIDDFDANGMMASAGPGTKRPSTCYLIAEIKGGKYRRLDPANGFRCDGTYWRP
jgi:ABC-type branched-subunit amino acid transport system substrate-binding protein